MKRLFEGVQDKVRMRCPARQPTIRRAYASMTKAT